MFIFLRNSPQFTGEYYRVKFVDGVSQDHVDADTFDKLEHQLGLNPQVLPEVECKKCLEHIQRIKELEAQLAKKKK